MRLDGSNLWEPYTVSLLGSCSMRLDGSNLWEPYTVSLLGSCSMRLDGSNLWEPYTISLLGSCSMRLDGSNLWEPYTVSLLGSCSMLGSLLTMLFCPEDGGEIYSGTLIEFERTKMAEAFFRRRHRSGDQEYLKIL
jgi:hypothetical protein